MAVRWVGQAARELGIPVWDAIALLVKEDAYPMNGLLDEERFQLLKRSAKKGVEASGAQPARGATVAPPKFREDATAVTAAMPAQRDRSPAETDRSEAKTVIYPGQT